MSGGRGERSHSVSARGCVTCFFRNHDAYLLWNGGACVGVACHRCGARGEKLWMTGAWFVNDMRTRLRRLRVRVANALRDWWRVSGGRDTDT